MKISRLYKDITFGIEIANNIQRSASREDMKIVRCILSQDIHNVSGVLRFMGILPSRYNKAIATGIFIALNK